MNTAEFCREVETKRDCDCEGFTAPGQEKPWGIRWNCGAIDPFTEESPVSFFYTAAEAIRAAGSMNSAYNPGEFPKTTEAVDIVVSAKCRSL